MFSDRSETDLLALELAITFADLEAVVSSLPKEISRNVLTQVRALGIRLVGATEFDAALASVPKK